MADKTTEKEIRTLATAVLGSAEVADDWLNRPNQVLGAKPIDLLDSAEGVEQVRRVLERIEYGVVN